MMMMIETQEVVWCEDRQRQRETVPGPPLGSHTSGTEWSMADLRRPVDILKTTSHINQHEGKTTIHDTRHNHIFQQHDMTETFTLHKLSNSS